MKSLVGENFGKYEVRRLLGKGGMGEVYEAFDTDKRRAVALKVLTDRYSDDDNFRERFLRESRAAAVLQEPHVIPIHDWGEIDHTLYIDMRLVDGQTLHDLVDRRPLEPQRAIEIIRQVAAALDAAHGTGLIHRDVKPQNIIVTPDDFAYLVDFGIAEARGETRLTMTGYQVGSFAYMAPERFNSDQAATSAVDIYALACLLYETLTGRPPFPGSHQQVIGAHLSSPPPPVSAVNPDVPAALDAVVARGMAKHPDDRYGSAGALARAAKRALSPAESASAADDTIYAGNYAPPPGGHQHFNAFYSPPPSNPGVPVNPRYEADNSSRYLVPTLIAVAAALVVVVIVLVVAVVGNQKSGSENPAMVAYPTSGPPTYQPTYQTSNQPTFQTTTPSTTRSVAVPTTTASASVPDAEQQLRRYVNGDHYVVATQAVDQWVPQLSSKRPGTLEGGVRWDNAMALREHERFRNLYNAKLLWSGEWSTFSESNYWVTIAGTTFRDSAGALYWCRSNGFDRDHCIAKLISETHPVAGSTAYN